MKYNTNELEFIITDAINNSLSMREAASKTKLNFKTFRSHAIKLGIYKPNQSGLGLNKNKPIIPIEDILSGKYPQYQTYKLSKRLIKENYKSHQCEICLNTEWNNIPISLELDHIDGNSYNHLLSNIRLVCPNCHSQTSNYRGKNKTIK